MEEEEDEGKRMIRQTFPRQVALKLEKNGSREKGGVCVMSRKGLLEQEKQGSEEREKLRGASKDRLMNRGPVRR